MRPIDIRASAATNTQAATVRPGEAPALAQTPAPSNSECFALRIGNQTSFAASDFLDPFRYALANGFEAFEWFPDRKPSGGGWDETSVTPALATELRQKAERAGLSLSLHARWTANPVQAEGWRALEVDLDLAGSLGATLLNLHLYTESGIEGYATALVPLLEAAEKRKIRVSIENTVETPPQAFNQLFDWLRRAKPEHAGRVGMCLDIGHANLCAATRNDFLGYLDQLDELVPVIHLHLHENWGDSDSHLPLFTGPAAKDPRGIAKLIAKLRVRNYSGAAILEQWPNPPSLLNHARDRLIELATGSSRVVSPETSAPLVRVENLPA